MYVWYGTIVSRVVCVCLYAPHGLFKEPLSIRELWMRAGVRNNDDSSRIIKSLMRRRVGVRSYPRFEGALHPPTPSSPRPPLCRAGKSFPRCGKASARTQFSARVYGRTYGHGMHAKAAREARTSSLENGNSRVGATFAPSPCRSRSRERALLLHY